MKGSTIIIEPNGEIRRQDWDRSPPLEFFQRAVGGYIEAVPYFDSWLDSRDGWVSAVAYCNETGKIDQLRPNFVATSLWAAVLAKESRGRAELGDRLVGPVVVVIGDRAFTHGLDEAEEDVDES